MVLFHSYVSLPEGMLYHQSVVMSAVTRMLNKEQSNFKVVSGRCNQIQMVCLESDWILQQRDQIG